MKPMLVIDRLCARYGATPALRDVSLTVGSGEIVCLVGQNGAGKSTALNAVVGGLAPRAATGSIRLLGQELLGLAPERIARLGVSLVPEGRCVFGEMTVLENLRVATCMRRATKLEIARDVDAVFALFPRLHERRDHPAGLLSGGEQQMLVIGRSVMTRAELLLIDEPSLGLAPKVIETVYQSLVTLRDTRGLTLLINEQSSNRVLRYADRVYVLRGGQVRLEGTPADLADADRMRAAYFGVQAATMNAEVAA